MLDLLGMVPPFADKNRLDKPTNIHDLFVVPAGYVYPKSLIKAGYISSTSSMMSQNGRVCDKHKKVAIDIFAVGV